MEIIRQHELAWSGDTVVSVCGDDPRVLAIAALAEPDGRLMLWTGEDDRCDTEQLVRFTIVRVGERIDRETQYLGTAEDHGDVVHVFQVTS